MLKIKNSKIFSRNLSSILAERQIVIVFWFEVSLIHGKQAIINVWDFPREIWNLFTLWKSCPTHHRGLIWFRISDRKFVNHTTEMILWSMILVDACKIFEPTDGNAEKALKVRANGEVYVCHRIMLTHQREQFSVLAKSAVSVHWLQG